MSKVISTEPRTSVHVDVQVPCECPPSCQPLAISDTAALLAEATHTIPFIPPVGLVLQTYEMHRSHKPYKPTVLIFRKSPNRLLYLLSNAGFIDCPFFIPAIQYHTTTMQAHHRYSCLYLAKCILSGVWCPGISNYKLA